MEKKSNRKRPKLSITLSQEMIDYVEAITQTVGIPTSTVINEGLVMMSEAYGFEEVIKRMLLCVEACHKNNKKDII